MSAANAAGKAGKVKPNVYIEFKTSRPQRRTLEEILATTAKCKPRDFTRITGTLFKESGKSRQRYPGQIPLEFNGATACFDHDDSVTVHIRTGTSVPHAQAVLRAICRALECHRSLEPFTPLEPVRDLDDLDDDVQF